MQVQGSMQEDELVHACSTGSTLATDEREDIPPTLPFTQDWIKSIQWKMHRMP